VDLNTTTYVDTGLTAATSCTYRVRAVNAVGPSDYYKEASTSTLPPPPAAPTELAATTSSQTQVALTWKDNSDNETGFEVERKTGSGSYSKVGSVGAEVITYTDSGLTASTGYTYR